MTHARLFPPPALVAALALAAASALAQTPPAADPAAPAPTSSAPAPVAPPPAANAIALPDSPVHIEQGERLKGVARVAIPSFQVYVLTDYSASSTAQGGSRHTTLAYVSTDLKVKGLTPERLKALSNSLYDDTVQQLQARGIAVVPHAELATLPAFAALKAAGDADGLAIDTSGGKGQVFAARDLPVIHMDEMGWMHRSSGGLFGGEKVEDPFVALGDKMSVGFRLVKLKPALQELASAAGVPLLQVRVVLTAAQLQAKGNSFFSSTAKTEASGSLVLPSFTNRFLLMTPAGDFARVSLDKPLASSTPLGPLRDVTSTGQTAANIAVTAFTMLAAMNGKGRGVVQNTSEMELQTDPDAFDALARPHASAVIGALARGFAAGQP